MISLYTKYKPKLTKNNLHEYLYLKLKDKNIIIEYPATKYIFKRYLGKIYFSIAFLSTNENGITGENFDLFLTSFFPLNIILS